MLARKVVVNECGGRKRVLVIVGERRSREEQAWNVCKPGGRLRSRQVGPATKHVSHQ